MSGLFLLYGQRYGSAGIIAELKNAAQKGADAPAWVTWWTRMLVPLIVCTFEFFQSTMMLWRCACVLLTLLWRLSVNMSLIPLSNLLYRRMTRPVLLLLLLTQSRSRRTELQYGVSYVRR